MWISILPSRDLHGGTVVGTVSHYAELAVPVTSYIAVALLLYYGTIWAGRKIYVTAERVNAVLDKIKD